jgi:hypothetical protein
VEKLRKLGAISGYSAAIVQAIAFAWYCVLVFSHDAHTNPISWWLWLGETLVGLLIYIDHTRDTPKWINEAVAFIGVVLVGSYLLVRMLSGDTNVVLAPVETIDIVVAVATVATFCFWLLTRESIAVDIPDRTRSCSVSVDQGDVRRSFSGTVRTMGALDAVVRFAAAQCIAAVGRYRSAAQSAQLRGNARAGRADRLAGCRIVRCDTFLVFWRDD